MKFPLSASTLIPVVTYKNLIFIQLLGFDSLKAANFWSECLVSLAFTTLAFFFLEWLWFLFRTKIAKEKSAYPFWQKFLGQVLTNAKTVRIGAAWLLFVALTFASTGWIFGFLTDESVAHFRFYLTLSTLLNFYTTALFSGWHLFLAPQLSAHRKLNLNK